MMRHSIALLLAVRADEFRRMELDDMASLLDHGVKAIDNLQARLAVPHYRIVHADSVRYRTMDTIGMPDWTTVPEEAVTFTQRKHADLFAMDDPEDVRVIEVRL